MPNRDLVESGRCPPSNSIELHIWVENRRFITERQGAVFPDVFDFAFTMTLAS